MTQADLDQLLVEARDLVKRSGQEKNPFRRDELLASAAVHYAAVDKRITQYAALPTQWRRIVDA